MKDQKVQVNLTQRHHLNEAERDKHLHLYEEDPPHSVGSLQKEKSGSWCFLYLPEDAMNIVFEAVSANKIKFITLSGEKTRYGFASIFNFSLREKVEDDE